MTPSHIPQSELQRRYLLSALGAGAIGLAGCIGDDEAADIELEEADPDPPTPGEVGDDDDEVEIDDDVLPDDVYLDGQELRFITGHRPDEMHFSYMPFGRVLDGQYTAPSDIYEATHEPGIWDRSWHPAFWPAPGDLTWGYYEDIEIEPETITATIRDDATWSDGEPMRAKDALATLAMWLIPPHDEYGWDHPPELSRVFNGAVKDYSVPDGMDGKVFQWHLNDHPGWDDIDGFLGMNEGELFCWLGRSNSTPRIGPGFPTHLELIEDIVDERLEQWDEKDPDIPDRSAFLDEAVDDEEIIEFTRQPENIVTSGAWTVSEIVGTEEVILEPNEHFSGYGQPNFDQVVFEWSEDAARTRAGIEVGRYDFATTDASPEFVAELPGQYSQVTTPSTSGHSFGVDHTGLFGDVKVRQAAMFAIDQHAVANSINPETSIPIEIPHWDIWFTDAFLEESWAQENLINYSQDLDRAEELMMEAGWSRGGDDIWEKDGEVFQTTISTPEEDPRFELTVEDQLSSFGMDLSTQTMDSATWNERTQGSNEVDFIESPEQARGDYDIWRWWAGGAGINYDTWAFWRNRIEYNGWLRAFNMFPHEDQEYVVANHYLGSGWSEMQYPLFYDWLVEIPPIGEPDAEPSIQFNPAYTVTQVFTGHASMQDPQLENEYYNPPHDEPNPENQTYWWQKLAWLNNWYLPCLPIALDQNQNFVNTENWQWDQDHFMWDYLGIAGGSGTHVSTNNVWGNPESPKDGVEVVER